MQKKVFIVDDDQIFSSMLADHLGKNKRLEITKFATGEACIEEMHQLPLSVLLDYNLNSNDTTAANGLAILEEIKKIHPRVNVVMLSSQESYGIAASTLMKGAEQYIIKDESAFGVVRGIIEEHLKKDA
jgi:DNA-binding NarL/FixJ family response regulator